MTKRILAWACVIGLAAGITGCSSNTANTKRGAVAGSLLGAAVGGVIGHQSGRGLEGAAIGIRGLDDRDGCRRGLGRGCSWKRQGRRRERQLDPFGFDWKNPLGGEHRPAGFLCPEPAPGRATGVRVGLFRAGRPPHLRMGWKSQHNPTVLALRLSGSLCSCLCAHTCDIFRS